MLALCIFIHLNMSVHAQLCGCRCLRRSEDGIRSVRIEVPDGCMLPDVGAGNYMLNFCESSKCIKSLYLLSDPLGVNFRKYVRYK